MNGYIKRGKHYEHRLAMERHLGRPLAEFENVHHKNGDRQFNNPSNLELWTKPQPSGQRVKDLVAWVCDNYEKEVRLRLDVMEAVDGVLADTANRNAGGKDI